MFIIPKTLTVQLQKDKEKMTGLTRYFRMHKIMKMFFTSHTEKNYPWLKPGKYVPGIIIQLCPYIRHASSYLLHPGSPVNPETSCSSCLGFIGLNPVFPA